MDEKQRAATEAATPVRQDKYTDNPSIPQLPEAWEDNPVEAIIGEAEAASEEARKHVGMLIVRTANETIAEAASRPNPADLYRGLWYEGEACCLFADSNVGKSIFAVQMGDEIARSRRVLYADFELSDKQFQLRYTDKETGVRHVFASTFFRAEIDSDNYDCTAPEDAILNNIEAAALRCEADTIIVDNLTMLCNSSEKGDAAGLFMMRLLSLKRKYGWSLLIIAHTPKRQLTNPITQNDLAGSKKLYNFFDSVFAIGQSAQDKSLRYVKQLKVRADEFSYGADNVVVYEVSKESGFLQFIFRGYASEADHLKAFDESDKIARDESIITLHRQGKSQREIARIVGVGKTTVERVIKRAGAAIKTESEGNPVGAEEGAENGLF